ncbi:MAG: SRPBCC family protein [Deltaproteobacteria bacterium]
MRFSARRDIESSAEDVFAFLTDYAGHESLAARRGVRIERIEKPGGSADRPAWSAEFQYGGRERKITIAVTNAVAPERLESDVYYQGLDVQVEVELVPLARTRTRMITKIDLIPQSIKARLVVQSLRLAKATIQRRLERRLETLAAEIETRKRS